MKIHHSQQQKGAVLVTTLVFLILLTLLTVTSLSTTTMEERMALNSQEVSKRLQVADSGISKVFNDQRMLETYSYCDPSDCNKFDNDSETGNEYGGSGTTNVGLKYRMTYVGDYALGATDVSKASGTTVFDRSFFDIEVKATNLSSKHNRTIKAGAYGLVQNSNKN